MKLRWGPGSPFVRKVTVTAIETGLDGLIERIETDHRAVVSDLVHDNPLGKVPALILDDGTTLADSPVICAYLDSLHDGPKLIPTDGKARWNTLNLEGLANGLGEAAINVFRERNRPDDPSSEAFEERNAGKFTRTMSWIEAHAELLDGPVTLGHIALGCALGWTALRVDDLLEDRETRWPGVSRWYAKFEKRPSMQATVPR
jgi:glutathione S-transferase